MPKIAPIPTLVAIGKVTRTVPGRLIAARTRQWQRALHRAGCFHVQDGSGMPGRAALGTKVLFSDASRRGEPTGRSTMHPDLSSAASTHSRSLLSRLWLPLRGTTSWHEPGLLPNNRRKTSRFLGFFGADNFGSGGGSPVFPAVARPLGLVGRGVWQDTQEDTHTARLTMLVPGFGPGLAGRPRRRRTLAANRLRPKSISEFRAEKHMQSLQDHQQ
jgi:hypothetical protein